MFSFASIQDGGNWIVGGSMNVLIESGKNGGSGLSGSILLGHFLWKRLLLEGVPIVGYSSDAFGSVTTLGAHVGLLYIPKPEAGVPFHIGAVFGETAHYFDTPEANYLDSYAAVQAGIWVFMSQKNFLYVDARIGSTLYGPAHFLVIPEFGFACMF